MRERLRFLDTGLLVPMVVLVLMGNDDGVTLFGALADGRQARASLLAAQTRIHQQARPLRRNPGGVPATSAGQHANANAQKASGETEFKVESSRSKRSSAASDL